MVRLGGFGQVGFWEMDISYMLCMWILATWDKTRILATYDFDFVELKSTLFVRNHFVVGRFGYSIMSERTDFFETK